MGDRLPESTNFACVELSAFIVREPCFQKSIVNIGIRSTSGDLFFG
jgi:hypothetical protein